MPRDFYPEGSKGAPEAVTVGRDFVPEGGLSDEQNRLGIKDTRRDDHPAKRLEPPKMAPLLDRDFILEAVIETPSGLPVGETEGMRGNKALGISPPGQGAKTAHEVAEEAAAPEELHPEDPRVEGGDHGPAAPEDQSGSGHDFEVPPGYEVSGTDEDGHPILRRKKTPAPAEAPPEPEPNPGTDPPRNKGGRPRKDAGAKGGEVNEAGDRALGSDKPKIARTFGAPRTSAADDDPPGEHNPFKGIFDRKPRETGE